MKGAEHDLERRALQRRLKTRGGHCGELDVAANQRLIRHTAAHQNQLDIQALFLKITLIPRNKQSALCHVEHGNSDSHLARLRTRDQCRPKRTRHKQWFLIFSPIEHLTNHTWVTQAVNIYLRISPGRNYDWAL